jgi:hypothetical protein
MLDQAGVAGESFSSDSKMNSSSVCGSSDGPAGGPSRADA